MKRRYSLKTVLIAISCLILILSVGGVTWVAFAGARSTARDLALQMMDQQARAVEEQLSRHLKPGVGLVRYMRDALVRDVGDLDDWQETGLQLMPLMETLPQFSWFPFFSVSSLPGGFPFR